jgi:hypothetical protein
MRKITSMTTSALACALFIAGCAEPAPEIRKVELTATVVAPPGVEGPVEVRVFHAWSLEGELRHPLQLIEIFPAEANKAFTRTIDYDVDMGEGLAVYGWIDTDGDGAHCTPTVRDELSGLAVVEDGPAEQVELTVTLTEPCRAPGWFYPPAG